MHDATALIALLSNPSSALLYSSSLLLLPKRQIQLSIEKKGIINTLITFQTVLDDKWAALSPNVAINSAQIVLEEHGKLICVSIKSSMKLRPAPQ